MTSFLAMENGGTGLNHRFLMTTLLPHYYDDGVDLAEQVAELPGKQTRQGMRQN